MSELNNLLKKEKIVQLAVRIMSVLSIILGAVIMMTLGSALISIIVVFLGFLCMIPLAFYGQKIQKQAGEMYHKSFLREALNSLLQEYEYIPKIEKPNMDSFYNYGILSTFNFVRVSEILQVQYPEGSLTSMNVQFEDVSYSYHSSGQERRTIYWGRILIFPTKKEYAGETYITFKHNLYKSKNPNRSLLSFNHSQLDRSYYVSATDAQVLKQLSDTEIVNLLLELAPLRPVISIKDNTVCVAIYTENKLLNYNYKAGFDYHAEYAKLQEVMERERRIMNTFN